MAVSKSMRQLFEEVEGDGSHAAGMARVIDRPCFTCQQEIGLDERPWFWTVGGEVGHIVMHRVCLLDWVLRIAPDVGQITAELKIRSREDVARLMKELERTA